MAWAIYNCPNREVGLTASFWSTFAHHVWLRLGPMSSLAQPKRQGWDRWVLPGCLSLAGLILRLITALPHLHPHAVTIPLIQEGSEEIRD